MATMKQELETSCTLHWWNCGTKKLSFRGDLKTLLKNHGITFTKTKTEHDGIFVFRFKSQYITFKQQGLISDFSHYAKQAVQMELVRMGDKSELFVNCSWRPTVTVNK